MIPPPDFFNFEQLYHDVPQKNTFFMQNSNSNEKSPFLSVSKAQLTLLHIGFFSIQPLVQPLVFYSTSTVVQCLHSTCISVVWCLQRTCIALALALAWHLHSTCMALAQHMQSTCMILCGTWMAFSWHLHSTCIALAQQMHCTCKSLP